MNDAEEYQAEIAGLRAQLAELHREVEQLHLGHIDLVEENRSLRRLASAFPVLAGSIPARRAADGPKTAPARS
jgi:hypothetical protein